MPRDLGFALLKEVSRSFYLTLRVLPASVRPAIGLAYLLARASDTIADTEIVPAARRLALLRAFRERIFERASTLDWGELAKHQGLPAERVLLERGEEILAVLATVPPADRRLIQQVLQIIISGQELDLERFEGATADQIVALNNDAEFDDYTYRVAGCVGEFWTRLCRAHVFPGARLDEALLLKNGVRFGQGLQMVNILRDLPKDLRQGRCYLPGDRLQARGLKPLDLLDPASEPRFRVLYRSYLDRAWANLRAGWEYTNTVPRSCVRVRLACAWPVLIGARTLDRLRGSNVLEASARVKISRSEVKSILFQTLIRYPWKTAWNRLFLDRKIDEVP
jgi:farnesyl-diphosphate farnesyltransferase